MGALVVLRLPIVPAGWDDGVHCLYDRSVQELPELGAASLRMEDGRAVAFPMIPLVKIFIYVKNA